MKSSSPVFPFFLFPLIICYREISFHLYIACFRLLGSKKHVLPSLKRKSDGYETVGTSWNRDLFHLLLSSLRGFLFFVFCFFKYSHLMGIHQLPKAHPQRTIQSAVMILYLFPAVPFYTSFKFLESFAYCVPLRASLRTAFSQKKKYSFLAYLLILYERNILFLFSPK